MCDFAYDHRSLPEKESLPYFSVGTARTSPTSEPTLYTIYTYDPLRRILTAANVLGTTSTSYNQWKTTVTDALAKQKILTNDAFNRLIRVEEKNGLETYVTGYEYNPLGNLIRITDAQSNVRNFSYDGLGRRTTVEDLHAPNDTTFGVWTLRYDNVGNLTERSDPKNQVVKFDYDALNRMWKEDFLGQAGVEVTYVYDNCPDGIGRLCSDSKINVTRIREYSALGQVKKETATVFAANYETRYEFDRQGNLTLLTNPDNSQIKYEYNQAGLLERILNKESTNPNFSHLVTDFDYAPTQNVTEIHYSSGARTIITYDANEFYRLRRKLTNNGIGQNIQDLNYTFDPVGNVKKIVDNSDLNTRKTLTYSYDDLHRLIWASAIKAVGGGIYDQQYAYDALGNITVKSDEGNYIYGGNQGQNVANPHAVTGIVRNGQTLSFSYDQNGNIELIGNSILYSWDYNNRLASANNGGVIINYGYASDGTRVSYSTGTSVTIYPTKFFNASGNVFEKNIFAGDMPIATIKGTGQQADVRFAHTDHLTSANVVTDMGGTVRESLDYYPFGAVRFDSAPTVERRKFAGHLYDLETGLSYMNARYYDGAKGRFFSQDPIYLEAGSSAFTKKWNNNWRDTKLNEHNDRYYDQFDRLREDKEDKTALREYLSNPQHLNSYSYVTNNPLKYVDPTGEWEVHLNFLETNLGLVGEAGNSWTLGFASDGTFGLSTTHHDGVLVGGDASIGISAGFSTAKTWRETLGKGQYVTVRGEFIGGVDVTTNYSNWKYTGTDVGFGVGKGIGVSVGETNTYSASQGNAAGIATGFKNVKNKVTNTVNQSWEKTTNFFRRIHR